jgi:DNA polymerase V
MSGDEILQDLPDFNTLLVENPPATFAVRVSGESMTGAGIFPGAICVVNRARTPANGSLVVAALGDGFTLKILRKWSGRTILEAANPAFADRDVTGDLTFEIFGCVSAVIHDHRV